MGVEGAERGDTNDWRALQGTDTFSVTNSREQWILLCP